MGTVLLDRDRAVAVDGLLAEHKLIDLERVWKLL
jgi:hypothetical protein